MRARAEPRVSPKRASNTIVWLSGDHLGLAAIPSVKFVKGAGFAPAAPIGGFLGARYGCRTVRSVGSPNGLAAIN
jgi:hypothetical protein